MSGKHKTLVVFEEAHGKPKIDRLQRELEVERRKVASLADVQGKINLVSVPGCVFRFGLLGDTHFGSLYAHVSAFRGMMEYYLRNNIDTVYHTGDVIDGHKVYKGHEFELQDLGLEAQLDRVVKATPAECPQIRFITGNHEASFKNLAGVPVGKLIAQACDKWEFLGEEQALVEFKTPNGAFKLSLQHPGGGTAYALSYKLQKIIESIAPADKPNLLAVGHYHKAEFLPSYRNVAGIQTATSQKQTPFMARNGLAAHLGFWDIEVEVGDVFNRIKAEFVAVYL